MKNLITVLTLLITTLTYSQTNLIESVNKTPGEVKLENVSITVTVDSAEEVESVLKMEDIKQLLDESAENEAITFKITCNGNRMSNGKKSHMSYTVKGNTDDRAGFLKSVEKMRNSAINYYKNKK